MRSFPAGFITEKNRVAGSRPAWVLKLMVSGAPVYISDRWILNFRDPETGDFVTTKAWVASWGQITEGITGQLGEFSVADFTVTLAVDPTESGNILNIIEGHDIESGRATLFAWYETGLGQGVTFPGQVVFSGYVKEIALSANDTVVTLTIQDDTLKLQGRVGGIVDRESFPDADPDDIGKVIPVVFGTIEKFPTLSVDAGIKTTLTNSMTAIQGTMNVSDAAGFWVGMWCGIDDETLLVTGISGSSVSITRAQDMTVAATHSRGADIIEIRTNDFAYLVADHPIQSVGKIWGKIAARLLDVTAICTVYTGQVGDSHPSYPGYGIVTVPGFITISQAAQLMLNDGIGVSDALSVLDGIGISDAVIIVDGKGISHTFSISDGKILMDGIDVTDTIGISNLLSVLDAITVGDSIAVSDTIGLSDAITVGDNIGVTDGIGVTDSVGVSTSSHSHSVNQSLEQSASGIGQLAYASSGMPVTVENDLTFASYPGTLVQQTLRFTITFTGAKIITIDGNTIYNSSTPWSGSTSYNKTTTGTGSSTAVIVTGANNTYTDVKTSSLTRTVVYAQDLSATQPVSKTGSATKTGTTTKTGGASRSGTISKTGGATKTGSASRGGSATLAGSVTKSGAATKTGTISSSGAIGLSGSAALTGSVSRSGAVTRTGNVTRSGAVTKTGTVTLTGNSVANTLIGDAILVDVVGLPDNDPALSIAWLLANYADYADAVVQIGDFPAGYTLNGAITDSNTCLYWINRIAFEFRSFFKFQSGVANLIVRPDSCTAAKTITKSQIMDFTRSKTAYEDIINQVTVRYQRDYTKSKGLAAYQEVATASDSASIAKYGNREKVDIFFCDFITSGSLAISIRDFYLGWYASRHWIYTLECFLDQIELEFGDQVGTDLRRGEAGIIRESGISPGNNDMDRVNLKIEI